MRRRVLAAVLAVLALGRPGSAEVVRVEVQSRADVAGGRTFGSVGSYERLAGKVFFAADPKNSANAIIADIDKAPRNAQGRVEFSSDFQLLKPKDMARANGALLYEVSNRGGRGMLGFFNRGAGPNDEAGDGFLMQNGFTLLWVGWQFDVPQRDGLLRLYPPVATDAGRKITGLVRSEIVVAAKAQDASLSDRNHVAYPVVDPQDAANTLYVRDGVDAPRRVVPRDDWKFTDGGKVQLASGFQPGRIYEVVYRSQDPPLVGLGPAAVRDAMSYLKYSDPQPLGIPRGALRRAIGFGISQSGRFLRTFLYYGFNEDEGHRKAFDGVMAHVAGGGRGSFNPRFAQPSRDGHPFLNLFYPTDIFPFTDVEQADPDTGARAGLLSRAAPQFLPKVFYTNSSYEYWGRAASLIHTTVDGRADAPRLDTTRVYLFAGGQHGPARFPATRTIGQQPNNPNDYRWFMRPLLLSMDRWIASGTPPPDSRYPRVADGSLVPLDRFRFPELPGVTRPRHVYTAYRMDLGPEFASKGIVAKEPPELGRPFPMLVPQVDADGNEIAGLRMPELIAPLATYTGWNLFNAESGPSDVLSSMQGSYIPFAATRAERERRSDPRPSVEERYRDRRDYLAKVDAAARELARDGYLLADDLPRIVEQAGRHYDVLVAAQPSAPPPSAGSARPTAR
jgi:hypothetical protein